ncbi:MAG: amidase [bacterium]|nr:amidase [bacterium]
MGEPSFSEYEQFDAVGLAELVANGETTTAELIEAAIERVEQRNPALNAVIVKNYEEARGVARSGAPKGPFCGVPFLTKDLAMVEGQVASFGSVFFREFRPDYTDEYQLRTQRAGLISIGRTNSPEFGLVPTTEPELHGATKNPWDRTRSSGGSSGGAAAAVAAGIVPMAHASDGGGSIRIPASACGVFGFKPSRGLMPRFPGSAADYLSLDLAVSRSVRDTCVLLDATHGAVPGAAYHVPQPGQPFADAPKTDPRPLRIAFAAEDFRGGSTDAACATAVTTTAEQLGKLGHTLVADKPVIDGQSMAEAFMAVWQSLAESIFTIILDEAGKQRAGAMLRRVLGDWRAMKVIAYLDKRKSGRDAFEPFTWGLADRSRHRTPAELEAAKTELQRVAHIVGEFLEDYDMLLTPVLGTAPVELGGIDQNAPWDEIVEQLMQYVAFTPVANFSGLPAMSVPTYWSAAGLPIGTHFMGRFADDALMLSVAGQLERAMPWFDRRPAV